MSLMTLSPVVMLGQVLVLRHRDAAAADPKAVKIRKTQMQLPPPTRLHLPNRPESGAVPQRKRRMIAEKNLPPKRPRGRPRKNPKPEAAEGGDGAEAPKKKRGRPKKTTT